MLITVGSVGLGLANIGVLYLLNTRRVKTGWAVNLALQVPLVAYDIATRQYGFLLFAASTAALAIKSLLIQPAHSDTAEEAT